MISSLLIALSPLKTFVAQPPPAVIVCGAQAPREPDFGLLPMIWTIEILKLLGFFDQGQIPAGTQVSQQCFTSAWIVGMDKLSKLPILAISAIS